MSGKRINNLAEHYLGSKNFAEATAVERNRFLDEVVRRYIRDANKKYCVENKYLLSYKNYNNGDINQPYNVSISVLSLSKWALSPYMISGRWRRCDSTGNVVIRCPYVCLFQVDLEYAPSGFLENVIVVASTVNAVSRHALYLTTNVNDIRKGGLNYDLTDEELSRQYRLIDFEVLKNIKVATVPTVSGQSEPTDVIRRLRAALGEELVLEPQTKIINTIKAIN
jgi:hypothetical protein